MLVRGWDAHPLAVGHPDVFLGEVTASAFTRLDSSVSALLPSLLVDQTLDCEGHGESVSP